MRHIAGCALLLLLVAGCTNSHPTLDEAAQVLATDMKKLAAFYPTTNKKTVDRTGKEKSDFAVCAKDETALRSYELSSDFSEDSPAPPAQRVESFSLLFMEELKKIGYEVDRESSWARPGRTIGVLHKKDPGITVILIAQDSQPNVEIIGKTDCMPEIR
ncbi:hypothetical protein AB0G15_07105 [Streptosporangium sp. NPDC023825]|uniref:hypothetical protein n=1 Tax=Streptosporangium sp. NPDC023825 TaxID=3154909 RepID=UPI00343E26C1